MDQGLADAWSKIRRSLGIVGLLLVVCVVLAFVGIPVVSGMAQALVIVFGIWLSVRWLRYLTRQAIWRLRNRLLVTYLFIAVVPLLLIVMLVGLGAYAVASQVAVHLMSSELERRIDMLTATAERLTLLKPDQRRYAVEHMLDMMFKERFQGLQVIVRDANLLIFRQRRIGAGGQAVGDGVADHGPGDGARVQKSHEAIGLSHNARRLRP